MSGETLEAVGLLLLVAGLCAVCVSAFTVSLGVGLLVSGALAAITGGVAVWWASGVAS